ncbi:hypothetical protein GLOIN_2v1883811 [Rhizophagus clarus]|uniref:Uncharacterized protein n=1 Tax=Rhizophagus clarus TaxID=94130 RepID=A0A8H3LFG1_9GLOM|nr:hypothetical protein GLOIN_2v1883811 [Rhizophagus clarus]
MLKEEFLRIEEIINISPDPYKTKKKIADEFSLILPDYINFMTEKYRKSQSPILTITSLESSPATSSHSSLRSLPLKSRTPMDNFERQLINNNLELLSQYFTKERHYPRSSFPRPNANVPDKYTEPKTNREYSQKQMSEILENNYSSFPKWILDIIYVELRALFLRTRHLDYSSRNLMIEYIISKLFPHFSKKKENKQKISFMGKCFRKVFDGWRSELWSNISFAYQNSCTNDNISQCLSEEVDDDKTARHNFFMANTDLYTINLDFACTDKIDVTRSMELSHYYISAARSFPEDNDEKNDNDEREQRKHKKKVTKKIAN